MTYELSSPGVDPLSIGVIIVIRTTAILAVAILGACRAEAPRAEPGAIAPPAVDSPLALVRLIDSTIPPAVAGADGWNFQQSAEADFDGDGVSERVVITARVELYRGRPAWDDGQPWQVYVESTGGVRVYLYGQRLQLGTLTMRVAQPEPGQRPSIVLLEHLPDRLRVIEASYPMGGGGLSTTVRFERTLDPRGEIASPQLP